jgi:hypothetical protein
MNKFFEGKFIVVYFTTVPLHIIKKSSLSAGRQWLTPVIPAAQETDQEDGGLKPAWANSFQDPISKKSHH